MKESKSNKIRSDGMLILFSILMVLSGMVVTAAAVEPIPNQFYGTVTVDGTDAPAGTNISAYIDGGLKGSVVVETVGKYSYDLNYLLVEGNAGDEITFTIDGTTADHTPTNVVLLESELPRELDLSTGDPPAVVATDSVIGDRTIDPTSLPAGNTFTVTVDVTVTGTVYGPVLNEDIPAGWTVTEVANAGASYSAAETTWIWLDAVTDTTKTVVYDVTVPTGTANGDYPVTGTVLATVGGSGIGPYSVTGDDGVTVADNTQDTSHDDATGSAPSGSGSDETPKPGPLPDVTMPESEEDASPTPSLTPATTQTTAPPATTIKKPDAEPKEGFIPGFEAAFVIAGLLVVAYLVRRRR